MNIIVSGAGGFIGTNMVLFLLEKGFNVLGFDLKKSKNSVVNENLIICDFLDTENVISHCLDFNPDYLIHLAAETGMESDSINDYNFNFTSIEAIKVITTRLPSIKKVIVTSSLLVCRNGYVPCNDFDLCPPNGYGHSKALSEALTRANLTNVAWDIVRPTSIWGEYFSGGYKLFFNLIKKNLFFIPKVAPIIKPTCYVGNAVYMIYKIMINHDCSRVFYLADYPSRSVQDWSHEISTAFNGHSKIFSLNVRFLKLVALFGDLLSKVGINFPLTSFRLKNMLVSKDYPTALTSDIVGPLPYNLSDSCARTVVWLRNE